MNIAPTPIANSILSRSVFVVSAYVMLNTAWTAPTEESWRSNERSYDLHAANRSRFVIESSIRKDLPGKIAKFVVNPGDQFRSSTGERSEVVLGGWKETSPFRVIGNEGVEYYRISLKLPPNWIAPTANTKGYRWGSVFQLHGPNEYMAPPSIALLAEDRFSLLLAGGDLLNYQVGRIPLDDNELNLGKWVDFILEIKWSIDSDGFISVYRRNEGALTWHKVLEVKAVPTLQYRGDAVVHPHYWKAGFYRSESPHGNTLWLGAIIRGKSFDEVSKTSLNVNSLIYPTQ